MSEHDYVIADAIGSAFLSDINLAFKALASNNLSATEPATMYAGMWWGDTTADLVKQRNAANTAWISWATYSTGVMLTSAVANRVDSGQVTVASHATDADIFAAAANTIDFTGTATVTDFPDAPKAGMVRTLIAASTPSIVASANLTFNGATSGTYAIPAGATLTVRSVSIATFAVTARIVYGFHAYRSTNQTSGAVVIFDTVVNQTGGTNYDNSTGIFTAPEEGWYDFSVSLNLYNNTGGPVNEFVLLTAKGFYRAVCGVSSISSGEFHYPATSTKIYLLRGETASINGGTLSATHYVFGTQSSSFSGVFLGKTI